MISPDLFPWAAGEVAASVRQCAPRSFHITGMRLERVAPSSWWADLHGYREDLSAPFVWLGFVVTKSGNDVRVELPPYLSDLEEAWHSTLVSVVRSLTVASGATGDEASPVVFVSTNDPFAQSGPTKVGGDRITPGDTFAAIWLHHAQRYRFAVRLATGARVLDLGCGVGYGSRMLSRVARRVMAVDLSPDAVAYARRAYAAAHLSFLIGDARRLPFPDASFDFVSCFEMIEHVTDHETLLTEVSRVLAPGGQFVVSTPNKEIYKDYPDPEHFHCGLLDLDTFQALMRNRFDGVELSFQPRFTGNGPFTSEFEVQTGAHAEAEIFIATARKPPARTVVSVPSPTRSAARRRDGMRILTFNWHEPYLGMLAGTGHEWVIADWHRPWNTGFRPLPENAARCGDEAEAAALVDDRRVDLVLCQSPQDLAWLDERPCPVIYLAHNSLPNEVRGREADAAERLRQWVQAQLAKRQGLFVAISEMKARSWALGDTVILPGIDVEHFGGYSGDLPVALTVANLLRERDHMLGFGKLEGGLAGMRWQILGTNPALGTGQAKTWEALKAAYRLHRLYAHATQWPWEDGFNLALLEAMATGMPVVSWANPTSPIAEGISGFLAEDAETFAHWARRLLADRELAMKLGAAGRRLVADRFPFEAFRERWTEVLERAANRNTGSRPRTTVSAPNRRKTSASAPRRRIVLATAWTPISTSSYYAKALADHDVVTWGPSMDEATFAEWQAATEKHELKATGTAEEKIRLLRALNRPADIPEPHGRPSISTLLGKLPRGWRPDLFVWIDGGPGFLPLDLNQLDCPTVCLVGDSHTQIDWRLEYAKTFSHVFLMFNRQHIALFQQAGCSNVGWLPAACDPEVHRAFEVPEAFDIVFVGQTLRQWHPDRVRLLERLLAAGFDVHVTTKILEEMALAFGRGRIVFNRSLAGDLNMRVFEAMATGRMLLTDRLAPESGLEELFRDRVHLVCYEEDTLETLARHYLEHADERREIAEAGRAEVLHAHTYRHRAAELLRGVLGDEPRAFERSAPRVNASHASSELAPYVGSGTNGSSAPLRDYYLNSRPEIADLVPASAARILDVGCGAGMLGRALKADGRREVVGIEVNHRAADVARQHLDLVLDIDIDEAEELPLEASSFDCVICADVLEHLRDPERVLRLLARYLRPDGVLVASIPNVRHVSALLPLLVHGRWQYRDEGILDRTHLRFFTLAEVLELLEKSEYRVRSIGETRSVDHPAISEIASMVRMLGGDADRFQSETRVLQFLLVAEPIGSPAPSAPTKDRPATSIVIPVRNGVAFTSRCLDALQRTLPAGVEVIVVDNASSDDTARLLERAPLPLRVLSNEQNEGFARACNQGALAAAGDVLVFLNNDTEPEPGWLEPLRTALEDATVGAVGARLLYPATRRIQHAGLALNPDGVPDHLWRCAEAEDPRATDPQDVAMVTGACLAIRRDLFERLGGFDETYRNGVEDVDLCLAVAAAGLRVRYEPRSVVLHHEGATAGRFDHVEANLKRFREKWASALGALPRRPWGDFGTYPGATVVWEGSFFLHHSLATVNREVCRALLREGVDLVLEPFEADEFDPQTSPATRALARLVHRPMKTPPAVRVRHRFPPDFSKHPGERLVIVQPWEFGAVPVEWVEQIRSGVDELWVPSEFVRASFVAGGVPPDRVRVIPNGFDPAVFHPDAPPLPLPTTKRFRFLYVGGCIYRKGYDLLLKAYTEEFTSRDDVCLVIKDHAYYRSRLDDSLAGIRERSDAPEILYYYDNVPPDHVAAFYTACDCLVHPFRGEGFGMPMLEAMACGRPLIVTDAGPAREFCPADAVTFVPARTLRFPDNRVDDLQTVGVPTLVEPDVAELRHAMRAAADDPAGCRARGRRAAEHVRGRYTWSHVAGAYAARLRELAVTGPTDSALALLAEGRVKEALPIFARIIRAEPNNIPALVGAAHCALVLDELPGARALLTRVLEIEPSNDGARAALSVIEEGAA